MARWLVAVLILAGIPAVTAQATCAGALTTATCIDDDNATATTCAAGVVAGTCQDAEADAGNATVNTTSSFSAVSEAGSPGYRTIETNVSPYRIVVMSRGDLLSSGVDAGVYLLPEGDPTQWACIYYDGGTPECHTAEDLAATLEADVSTYEDLILDATQMLSCNARTRTCTLPLG